MAQYKNYPLELKTTANCKVQQLHLTAVASSGICFN